MKSKLTAALTLGVLSAVAANVLAGDTEVGKQPPRPFAMVFIDDTPAGGEKAFGKSKPSKAWI